MGCLSQNSRAVWDASSRVTELCGMLSAEWQCCVECLVHSGRAVWNVNSRVKDLSGVFKPE